MSGKDIYDIVDKRFDRRTKREALIVDADRFKTYDEVFDRQNLDHIYRLMKRGHISTVECPVSTGKEANVYKASTSGGNVAMKIFRTSTATFGAFLEYMEGDRRFQKIDRSRRGVINTWARKEHLNLSTMYEEGLRVPEPGALFRNVLLMDYIEFQEKPAPQLRVLDTDKGHWEEMWETVKDFVTRVFKDCHLVHADLSEYNILYDGEPIFIDVGQSVETGHPHAPEFLHRDLSVISRFFSKKGLKGLGEEVDRIESDLIDSLEDEEE